MDHRNTAAKVHFRLVSSVSRVAQNVRVAKYRALGALIGTQNKVGHIDVLWSHQLKLGNENIVEDGVRFNHAGCLEAGPNIVIGDRCFIGSRTEFIVGERIEVGNDCMFAAGCHLTDLHHEHFDASMPMRSQPVTTKPIRVEDDVWLGTCVTVLKGVTIGRGAIVAAGAVVTKSVPAYEIWGGVPARRIGTRLTEER